MLERVNTGYITTRGDKVHKLCVAYDAVNGLYRSCASPEQGLSAAKICRSAMPPEKSVEYERKIRLAMLEACRNKKDLQAYLYGAPTGSATMERMRGQLRDAFERREKMPYDRRHLNMSPVVAVNNAWHGLAKPFHTMNKHNIESYRFRYPSADANVEHSVLAAVEYTPDRTNICISSLPGTDLERNYPAISKAFCGWLRDNTQAASHIEYHPVVYFMHTPVEYARSGRDEFNLVHETPDGHEFMPLHVLPRVIDRTFHDCHHKVTNTAPGEPAYNDFRTFSLWKM